MKNYILLFSLFLLGKTLVFAQKVELVVKNQEHKVEVLADGKPFTTYFFPSDTVLKKPVLVPIYSPNGTVVTRGYPLSPRAGERIDHPHHVGLWLNYEYVNGFDFWNNSNAIKNPAKYGTIYHTKITKMKSGKKATLGVEADWITANGKGKNVLKETTTYVFQVKSSTRIIDRITTLTAQSDTVFLNDVKDGMIALRLARELEHPSDKADEFLDANGIVTKVDKLDNTNITGKYRSSAGIEGDSVWSTRAKWVNLTGRIGTDNISICMIDHPKNLRYPTYWHARGYGLFAANPLGAKVFSKGADIVNLKLAPKQSITFRYRIVVASHHLSDAENNVLAEDFAKVK
jgi:Methane oxygenase PmoA